MLIEERHLPASEGVLESKTTSMTAIGLVKTIKEPYCDSCGQTLKDQRIAICSCKKKICQSCVILIDGNKIYCRECAKKITAITKQDFFALYGIANGVGIKDIKHSSSMNQDCIDESISMLVERCLIEEKGLSIFVRYVVTDKGLAVLATCEQIYRNEGDVLRFLLKIQEFME